MTTKQEKDQAENIMRARYIENQVQVVYNQLKMVEHMLIEITTTISTLEEMQKVGEKEALFPLGAGVFATALLKKQDKVLIDVGSQTVLEKKIPEAVKDLKAKEEEAQKQIQEYQTMLENLQEQYLQIIKQAQAKKA